MLFDGRGPTQIPLRLGGITDSAGGKRFSLESSGDLFNDCPCQGTAATKKPEPDFKITPVTGVFLRPENRFSAAWRLIHLKDQMWTVWFAGDYGRLAQTLYEILNIVKVDYDELDADEDDDGGKPQPPHDNVNPFDSFTARIGLKPVRLSGFDSYDN